MATYWGTRSMVEPATPLAAPTWAYGDPLIGTPQGIQLFEYGWTQIQGISESGGLGGYLEAFATQRVVSASRIVNLFDGVPALTASFISGGAAAEDDDECMFCAGWLTRLCSSRFILFGDIKGHVTKLTIHFGEGSVAGGPMENPITCNNGFGHPDDPLYDDDFAGSSWAGISVYHSKTGNDTMAELWADPDAFVTRFSCKDYNDNQHQWSFDANPDILNNAGDELPYLVIMSSMIPEDNASPYLPPPDDWPDDLNWLNPFLINSQKFNPTFGLWGWEAETV